MFKAMDAFYLHGEKRLFRQKASLQKRLPYAASKGMLLKRSIAYIKVALSNVNIIVHEGTEGGRKIDVQMMREVNNMISERYDGSRR